MPSTLDKLKALNDKLEAKLTQQNVSAAKKGTALKTRTRNASENVDKPSLSYSELADMLIAHLHIDTGAEPIRTENIKKVSKLYVDLGINEKAPEI